MTTAGTGEGLATFGLLAPLVPRPAGAPLAPPGEDPTAALLPGAGLDALWLRDLPCVAADDDDAGQGTDPFAHVSLLAGLGVLPPVVGTASVILGTRHPTVLAQSVATAQAHSGGRFVLGVGSGGKPAMNAALGLTGRSLRDFAQEWRAMRAALDGSPGPGLAAAAGGRTPVHLATGDAERWRALDGDPDGWLAFAGDPDAFDTLHRRLERVSGRRVPVSVRLDAVLVAPADDPGGGPTERGRVVGSVDRLGALLGAWRRHPAVEHVMVRLVETDPAADAAADLARLRGLSAA